MNEGECGKRRERRCAPTCGDWCIQRGGQRGQKSLLGLSEDIKKGAGFAAVIRSNFEYNYVRPGISRNGSLAVIFHHKRGTSRACVSQ